MNLRLVGLALLCGASTHALADPERDRISAERAAANARLAERERECSTRFVVAPCVGDARTEHRAEIARLRQRELELDEGRRRQAAEARRKAIADKAEAQQARASDPAPDEPRVRVRRAPQPVVSPAGTASHPSADTEPARRASEEGSHRVATEQRNQQGFDARQREAQAHREAIAKRNAERATKRKAAAPLPPPAGASAPR